MPKTLDKAALISSLKSKINLSHEDAEKAVDHIVAGLVFSKPGGLMADNNCGNGCGGAETKTAIE